MHIDIIFFIAEIFLIFSYLCRKILLLRIGAALGMGSYALGAFIAGLPEKGMTTIFVFGVITVIINLYEVIRIVKDGKPIKLPENLKEIYDKYFNSLTPKEFLKVYQNLEIKIFQKGENLSVENEMTENIYFIKSGVVDIIKDKKIVKEVGAGFFIGEIGFFKEDLANATVTVASNTAEIFIGRKKMLADLENKNPELYSHLKQCMILNLIRKLG